MAVPQSAGGVSGRSGTRGRQVVPLVQRSPLRGGHSRRADLGDEAGLQADAAAGEVGGPGRPVTDLWQRRAARRRGRSE